MLDMKNIVRIALNYAPLGADVDVKMFGSMITIKYTMGKAGISTSFESDKLERYENYDYVLRKDLIEIGNKLTRERFKK